MAMATKKYTLNLPDFVSYKFNPFAEEQSQDYFSTMEQEEKRVIALALHDDGGPCTVHFYRFGSAGERAFPTFIDACLWCKEVYRESHPEWCAVQTISLASGEIIDHSTTMWDILPDGSYEEEEEE